MDLLDKVTIDDLMKIKKMDRDEAARFLDRFKLTPSELNTAMKLVKPRDKHFDNRLWLSVGWLLGASFAQLARDKGVAKQSVMVQVDKLLPLEERRKGRLSGGALSLEALSEYKVAFFENLDTIRDLTPKEAAIWLLEHTSLDTQPTTTTSESN